MELKELQQHIIDRYEAVGNQYPNSMNLVKALEDAVAEEMKLTNVNINLHESHATGEVSMSLNIKLDVMKVEEVRRIKQDMTRHKARLDSLGVL